MVEIRSITMDGRLTDRNESINQMRQGALVWITLRYSAYEQPTKQ
jgi:hypothetical protein